MLGLPDGTTACLFDPDGVLTRTATVHGADVVVGDPDELR
jgi:hypothetical protein